MIFNTITEHYLQNKPFVVYRKANEEHISGFFQQDKLLYTTKNYSDSGFIFAPFDDKEESILIPVKHSKFISEKLSLSVDYSKGKIISEVLNAKFHKDLVVKGIQGITENKFKKVVLSRKEVLTLSNFDLNIIYKRLLQKYPTAFVYVWFHPKVGLWLGATPETLLKTNGTNFETMERKE